MGGSSTERLSLLLPPEVHTQGHLTHYQSAIYHADQRSGSYVAQKILISKLKVRNKTELGVKRKENGM